MAFRLPVLIAIAASIAVAGCLFDVTDEEPGDAVALGVDASDAVSPAGATYTVSSIADLRSRINAAAAGDTIIVANGSYSASSSIAINRKGTASQPITIRAQSVGAVTITGSAGFTFGSSAAYVELRGFVFAHAAGSVSLPSGSHHCRVTRNVFRQSVPSGASRTFLSVAGDDHEISYNTFRDKHTEGQMLSVQGPGGSGMAQRTWIHHNYFLNFTDSGANNSSALHIGHSGRSLTAAHSLVEYNLFVNTRAENEGAICNKSSDNVYRYNTLGANTQELSLRHGNRVEVYGNFFIGSEGGLRFFGDDHRIYSNYFEGCTRTITVGNGDCTIPPGELRCHDRPDRVHVTFNTLVNNTSNLRMSGRSGGKGATDLVIANNLIQGGGKAAAFAGPTPGATWQGNILWNASAGNMQGFTTLDPRLAEDSTSAYRLSESSPAIDRAVGSYSYASTDMDQQGRTGAKDVGADEVGTGPKTNRILTPADVGPNAGL